MAGTATAACSIWWWCSSSSSRQGAGSCSPSKSVAVVVAAAPPLLQHQHQKHESLACSTSTFLISPPDPCRPHPRPHRHVLLKSNALSSKDEQMAHPTPTLNTAVAGDPQGNDVPPSKKNLPPFTFDLSTASSASGLNPSSLNESSQVLVASTSTISDTETSDGQRQDMDRAINAMIIASAGAFAITKILTVDRDYWHGWTVFEILKYAPLHNWSAYEGALQSNPVLAKMMISGIVYSIGDWFAQCYEGKRLLDINRERIFRSGLVGFCLHGSLSHFYYYLCEFLFPFKDWWGVPIKVAFDQTIWSGFWNSVYFVTLGILRLEPPQSIFSELKATFWPMLSAGWKLWPFAHIITYGVIPVEQRLLWVDCVELIWVTILSMYSNEKAEARSLQESSTAVDVSLAEQCTSNEEN